MQIYAYDPDQLTPWFEPGVEPVRDGVYWVSQYYANIDWYNTGFNYWKKGSGWSATCMTVAHAERVAFRNSQGGSKEQTKRWRGLVAPA